MINLNLLPEEYKKEYAFEKTRRFIVFVTASFSFIFIVFITLLFFSYIYLKIETKSILTSIDSIKTDQKVKNALDLEENVKMANTKISIIDQAKKENVSVFFLIEEISNMTGDRMHLKSININTDNNTVSISGFAEYRDSVLALQEKLEKSSFVEEGTVVAPKSNILKEKDIDFSFNFNFKK